jgi:putative CocE/NonD family hydrolase
VPLKHSIVSIAILALAQATVVHAQADAGDFTKSVTIEKDVGIAMRDGTRLSADIYRPDKSGTFPALILRTPYNKAAPDEVEASAWYARKGYVVINQDVRGRFASAGTFYTFRNETGDGADTIAWIERQPWFNGRIGTLGGSYLGYTALTQAIRAPKSLRSIATDVTTSAVHNQWVYVDGAFVLGFGLPWGAGLVNGRDMSGGGAFVKEEAYQHLPLAEADAAQLVPNSAYRDWLHNPSRNSPYWKSVSLENQISKVKAPVLLISGWYDIFLRGALNDYAQLVKRGSSRIARTQSRLIIGPWTHFKTNAPRLSSTTLPLQGADRATDFGPSAELSGAQVYLRWHDHWLKDMENGVGKDARIKLFVMGENRWRDEQEWPLARTLYKTYFLDSGGQANTVSGNGTLSLERPRGATADRYRYNPADPTPTLGGNICCSSVPSGPRNHAPIESRRDVLVYSTPPLENSVEVTGPIRARIFASTSARDTDWVVRLLDVGPDGFARNLQDGIVRARWRRGMSKHPSLVRPDAVIAYDIDLWATSNLFLPGHRIRVEITSSNFPRFDRNLNTGEDPSHATRMVVADQAVYHSSRYPSHITLPIIPR